MDEATRCADVIDFFWEWQRRQKRHRSDSIRELALDGCEEAFRQGNWREFAYWHAIYCSARSTSRRRSCFQSGIVKPMTAVHPF